MAKCEICHKPATYGVIYKKPLRCGIHRNGMENVKSKRCALCKTRPSFGVEWKKPTHCKQHALSNMEDVVSKRCEKCSTRATFGKVAKLPTHCKEHATSDMVDNHIKCVKCKTRASFGVEWKKPTHCKQHALANMEDVVSKRCNDCSTRASFGIVWKKPTHCREHATTDMKDVVNKRCALCETQASFGNEWNKPTHCKSHATDDMKDVKSVRCINCDTYASYGLQSNKTPTHCKTHATAEMVSNGKKCTQCSVRPSFGFDSNNATHCKTHALDGMTDVISTFCLECFAIRANPKYKSYCARCYFYLNPNDPRIINYKTKEHTFMIPLSNQYPNMILDKIVQGGCSKRRPDGLLDCFTHSIIIEIDENQHSNYDPLCESRRTMELFVDLGSRPLILIRLNPDSYTKANTNHRTNGCFSLSTKTGELKLNEEEINIRLNKLYETIESNIQQIPESSITTIQLYYDAY